LPEDAAPAWLRRRMTLDNFKGANALYCLDPGDADVVQAAKDRGMLVVYEQIIVPQVGWILREERSRFPDLEVQDSEGLVEAGIRLEQKIWKMADLVLAPSEFVKDGLTELGAPADRIGLVPYGLPDEWFGPVEMKPIPGRVLFVGGVSLRKGNHYLAEACRILADRGVAAEFRVVGPYDARAIASPLFRGPEYVGQVPRGQVHREFLSADVFAFPTLAEGFALSHLEAMACGVPVVTTPNCGPAVRDGQDGFVVPPRDARALADRIATIIQDRALRKRMGESARERAATYSWGHYRQRLLDAVDAADQRRAA
jgi:glycosyltransferase involved in cell wall biosynthesis